MCNQLAIVLNSPEGPTAGVKHYPERRERPPNRPHTVEEFLRILEVAPTHLRVAIVLLEQTGNRTYTELLSLEMNRIDFENGLILLGDDLGLKTEASAAAQPLSSLALKVLRCWKDQLPAGTRYLFPSPVFPDWPISSVKTAWRNTLKRAGIPYFPIYQLTHAFCTRMGKVSAEAVLTQAMRHSSPETKREYLMGMRENVREDMEMANEEVLGEEAYHILIAVTEKVDSQAVDEVLEAVET